MESLLYYEYERDNFFKLLKLSKENAIDNIAFLRKSGYEFYKNLGYKCSYLMENYILNSEYRKKAKSKNDIVDIGITVLNYSWDKNIFNQLCIGKFIKNCNINYNLIDERIEDFLTTMKINSTGTKLDVTDEKAIIDQVSNNDINVSFSFTEYMHPIFFVSIELGIPCIIGNTSDFFIDNPELEKYVVSKFEDNPILNAKLIENALNNKEKIIELYSRWKKEYNLQASESIQNFLNM